MKITLLLAVLSQQVSSWTPSSSRRWFLQAMVLVPTAAAAETVGKDANCLDSSCLGVWDGLLADCPTNAGGAGCASSQDDRPGVFAEPWDYSEVSTDYKEEMSRLVSSLQRVTSRRGDRLDILLEQDRYVRVLFTDGKTGEGSIAEFYMTPNDTTVQFRIAGTSAASFLSLRNMDRAELLRKELGYLKLPVLRNRRRSFLFVESDALDSFGPGYSPAAKSPAEMTRDERGF
jgi:uncharacterized protein (DUF1499 family)